MFFRLKVIGEPYEKLLLEQSFEEGDLLLLGPAGDVDLPVEISAAIGDRPLELHLRSSNYCSIEGARERVLIKNPNGIFERPQYECFGSGAQIRIKEITLEIGIFPDQICMECGKRFCAAQVVKELGGIQFCTDFCLEHQPKRNIFPLPVEKVPCIKCGVELGSFANSDGWHHKLTRPQYLCEKCHFHCHKEFDEFGKNRLIDPFIILEKIGAGGMGTVFKVVDTRTRRIIALKTLQIEKIAGVRNREIYIQRFHREFKDLFALTNGGNFPGIIKVFEFGALFGNDGIRILDPENLSDSQSAETLGFTCEYIDGGSFESFVDNNGRRFLPAELGYSLPQKCLQSDCAELLETDHIIVKAVYDALEVLAQYHEFNVSPTAVKVNVHRDIKPSNILFRITPHENENALLEPVLADFGLSKMAMDITFTRTNFWGGSLKFLSKEMALNFKSCGVSADLYSIGVVLYYLLSGNYPLPWLPEWKVSCSEKEFAPTAEEIMLNKTLEDAPGKAIEKIREEPRIPIERFRANLPVKLQNTINKAVSCEKKDRFCSAREFQLELFPFISSTAFKRK